MTSTDDGEQLSVREAYRRWACSYPRTGTNPLSAAVDRAVLRILPEVRGLSVLDVGSGTGRWSSRLVDAGANVVGIDPVIEMLAMSTSPSGASAADARALPFGRESFDAVICVLVIGHVDDPAEALSEFERVLVPGGWLVLADVHAEGRARGWRRTFRDEAGNVREVPWTAHEVPRLRADALRVGLRVEAHTDERLLAAELPERLRTETDVPAAYALRAIKF